MQIEGINLARAHSRARPVRRDEEAVPRGFRPHADDRTGWLDAARDADRTMLDLFEPDSELIPTYGLNDGIVFGFLVDDIEAASAELEAARLVDAVDASVRALKWQYA